MNLLAATVLGTSSQVRVRVTGGSLLGRRVTVRIHEWHLEVCYQSHLIGALPRLVGDKQYRVSHRYVIDSLLCKPGGLRDYRYRGDLFPSLVYRQAWERLNQWQSPRKADLA